MRYLVSILLVVSPMLMFGTGCAEDSVESKSPSGAPNFNNLNDDNNEQGRPPVERPDPEPEREFEFAEPTVIGDQVYVANESLNSVAVVDSSTLSVTTIPVGFQPTIVAGPRGESVDESRVFVLNEGSESVTVIDPGAGQRTHRVLRSSNRLVAGPLGRTAVSWVDPSEISQEERFGGRIDLAAVSLIREDDAFQISVGFNIRDVVFDASGDRIFVLSDDGVSVIEPGEVDDDQISPPRRYAPSSQFAAVAPESLETLISSNGEYVLTRSRQLGALVMLEVESDTYHVVNFPTTPTDIDWAGDDRLLVTLGDQSLALVADVPDGIIAAAEATDDAPNPPPSDMGSTDMGMDLGSDAGMDMADDLGLADMDGSDMGMADMDPADMASDMSDPDQGVDLGADMAPEVDMDVPFDFPFMADGVDWLELPITLLRFASVDPGGTTALFYNPSGEERAVILNLTSFEMRGVLFEKPVVGATAGPDGQAFVLFHRRDITDPPPNLTPADPEYIAASWAISLLDVKSGANRLVLTEHEPGPATIFSKNDIKRLYMLFESAGTDRPRTVLSSDLSSFVTTDFTVASPPLEIGPIVEADRIYISQKHPQGRMTLVDVADDRKQTITGYQLNAGID